MGIGVRNWWYTSRTVGPVYLWGIGSKVWRGWKCGGDGAISRRQVASRLGGVHSVQCTTLYSATQCTVQHSAECSGQYCGQTITTGHSMGAGPGQFVSGRLIDSSSGYTPPQYNNTLHNLQYRGRIFPNKEIKHIEVFLLQLKLKCSTFYCVSSVP